MRSEGRGARVHAPGVGNRLLAAEPTLQAISRCTSNAWKPSRRKPQSAMFFSHPVRTDIPDAISPGVVFRFIGDSEPSLRSCAEGKSEREAIRRLKRHLASPRPLAQRQCDRLSVRLLDGSDLAASHQALSHRPAHKGNRRRVDHDLQGCDGLPEW
jgi:hypothetical protein